MKSSLILTSISRLIFWPMLMLSVLLYWRGHQMPGGGFVGGLVAASAFSFWGFSFGRQAMCRRLIFAPTTWMAVGLVCAYGSGFISVLSGRSFLAGAWIQTSTFLGELGTPMLFDFGVYCVVVGMVVMIVTELLERET